MIRGTFRLGGDIIEAIIDETNLFFRDLSSGTITTIEGLKLSRVGTIKQFPDLEEDKDWKEKGIKRFKEHLKKLRIESQKIEYIKEELLKHGYTPLIKQKAGFRPERFK